MAKEKKSKKSKDKKVKRASESSSAVEAAKELIVSTSSANSEEGLTEIKKQVKKKLRKTLGRKPTKEEVEARVQKRLKKAAKAGSADGKESKTTEAPAAPTSAGVVELPKKMKSHKKEKKSAESDRKAKRKRTNGGDEDEEGVSTRLDWTEAQVQGGTQRKDKFLRLMGGKKSDASGTDSGGSSKLLPPGSVIASLMSEKATTVKSIFSFPPKRKLGGPAQAVDVNSGTQKNRALLAQCERAQDLLRSKHKNGGRLGFSV